LLLLLFVVLLVFVVWNKQRVYVRDPLASVTRDGVKVAGEQVYINFSNDALLENDNPPMHLMLAQRGQPLGVPAKIHCIHWMACLTDADIATTLPLGRPVDNMSNKAVEFRDNEERAWVVTLR
jgi:hypothetical protein